MSRPNFDGVPLFKNPKDQSIVGAAHEKDLDYEPSESRSFGILRVFILIKYNPSLAFYIYICLFFKNLVFHLTRGVKIEILGH